MITVSDADPFCEMVTITTRTPYDQHPDNLKNHTANILMRAWAGLTEHEDQECAASRKGACSPRLSGAGKPVVALILQKYARKDVSHLDRLQVSQWWAVSLESASSCCPLVQESPSVAEVLQLLPRRREAQMQINDRSGTLVGLWLITTLPLPAVV